MNKFSSGIFLFLFLIGLSKELVIINAEALVALCFLVFIYLVKVYFSETISQALTERAVFLEKEFSQSILLEKQQLSLLKSYYCQQLTCVPLLQSLFILLKDLHTAFKEDVSLEMKKYHLDFLKNTLQEVKLQEVHFAHKVHKHFISRCYVSDKYFATLLPVLNKKMSFPPLKEFFRSNLASFV